MNKIKKKIKDSFNNIKLPDFDMDDLKKRKGMVYMKEEKKTRKKGLLITLSTCLAVCICLFVGLSYFNGNIKVASKIGIDVNPSIEIAINKKEKVLDVMANNEAAKVVLEGMDLKGSDINVAVNALIGSMVRNGYIDELANSILISVDNPDSAESERLRQKIVDQLNTFISNGNSISVVSQNINSGDDKTALAEQYGISVGKLELIEKLIAKNNLYTYEGLKDLSINELNLLLGDTTENVNTSGSASDKAYIGRDKALELAYEHAGVSASDVTASKVEMDYDDGLMVYEVEFYYNNREYDYEIDAINGAMIKAENEYDDDALVNNNSSTSNNSSNSSGSSSSANNSSSSSTNNNSSSSSSGQGSTSVDTSGITSTLSDYTKEAESIQSSINSLTIPSNRSETVSLYWEWKSKIETLENKMDRYEDELERMYRNNQLSYNDYRTFDRQLESIEDILDRAGDNLERRTNYDD